MAINTNWNFCSDHVTIHTNGKSSCTPKTNIYCVSIIPQFKKEKSFIKQILPISHHKQTHSKAKESFLEVSIFLWEVPPRAYHYYGRGRLQGREAGRIWATTESTILEFRSGRKQPIVYILQTKEVKLKKIILPWGNTEDSASQQGACPLRESHPNLGGGLQEREPDSYL